MRPHFLANLRKVCIALRKGVAGPPLRHDRRNEENAPLLVKREGENG